MVSVFFSYSHKDEALRDQLEAHLALLRNQGLIDVWHDRRIVAGNEVDNTILAELQSAHVILLLVSSDFIASTYCYSREMLRAMERHDAGEARVIPVILRACDWHTAPFGKLLAAPRDGRPVNSWPDKDEAFADVAKQVRAAIETMALPRKAHAPSQATLFASRTSSLSQEQAMPRSSNLRLKKEFTERDRDDFLRDTYDYVSKFFQGSIDAIAERNPGVTGSFDQIDSRRFAAILYRHGKAVAECSVRLEGFGGRGSNCIAFSHDASARTGSFNEMLSVDATEQFLYLKPLGFSWGGGGGENKHHSQEGAAEFLWGLFIRPLQQ